MLPFLFVNKTSRLSNLKTRTAMNAKALVFVICVKAVIYNCYYIICMLVPLSVSLFGNLTQNTPLYATVL